MPIKLPKGFSRRKSSATALEEVANPPQPSFRVFERPPGGSKSFDGGIALKRMSQSRPLSSPSYRVDENLFDDERDDTDPSHRLVGDDGDSSWRARLTYGRGSGGTHHSSYTGVLYDTSSSSARFSSTSTLPSSTDATSDEPQIASSKALPDIPPPPMPDSQPAFSVRAGGRTFSFGRKAVQTAGAGSTSKSGNAQIEPRGSTAITRERAMTESSFASASTATPPKLLDTDLNLDGSDLDGFGNMFENFERRRSRALDGQGITLLPNTASPEAISPSAPAVPPKSYSGERSRFTPSPINIDRTQIIDSSPYSWGSHDSHDGLMSSSTPPAPFHSFDPKDSPPVPRHGKSGARTPTKTKPVPDTASPTLQRTGPYASRYGSSSLEDSDAKMVVTTEHPSPVSTRLSAAQTRGPRGIAEKARRREDKGEQGLISTSSSDISLNTPSSSVEDQTSWDTVLKANAPIARYTSVALFDSEDPEVAGLSNSWRGESTETTPRAKKLEPVRQDEPPLFDPSLTASVTLAAQYEDSVSPSPTKQGQRHKVMTPAQFERYRQQQEMTRTKSTTSRSEASEDGSDVDDDDETERNRQAARQRRKQEAHLAVYRQQMMKVTGEQPAELPMLGPSRSGFDRSSNGTPTTLNRLSTVNLSVEKPADSGRSSDDEDEDVPLGILAAHGFPSKHRPPSHLGNANPNSIYRASIQSIPSAPGSVAGESSAGGPRNSLPVFARNLPQDPYYGASLVNPSNREFLNNSGGSVYGGPQPSRPPGGLVGVIAGEERARAMRRGSPNAQGVYGPPGALEGGMPQMYPGMPRPMAMGNMSGMSQPGVAGMPPVPMMTPADQAQFQMTQQMAQMMQVQMQWMQQMMQMQGVQPNGQPLPPLQSPAPTQQMTNNRFLSPPGQTQRPMSMGSHMAQSTSNTPQMNQRAMSMLDPGMASWGQPNDRRSSFLPSMSGGLGSQSHAPSIAPSERSNVGMPSRYRPVSIAPEAESKKLSSRTSTFTSGTLQGWTETQEGAAAGKAITTKKPAGRESDEDEEEGWEEMRRKRENKKSTWRLRKSANGLQDMYYPGT